MAVVESNLFTHLIKTGLPFPHEEVGILSPNPEQGFKGINPQFLSFISYLREWCFSRRKDAALLTLQDQMGAFLPYFELLDRVSIEGSERTLFLFKTID